MKCLQQPIDPCAGNMGAVACFGDPSTFLLPSLFMLVTASYVDPSTGFTERGVPVESGGG